MEMVYSLDSATPNRESITAHVFTDQPERALEIAGTLTKIKVMVHEIPPTGWPNATLKRYQIFKDFEKLLDQDILMHIDADMKIVGNLYKRVSEIGCQSAKRVCLVLHPGFWRPEGLLKTVLKYRSVRSELSRGLYKFRNEPFGAWENRSESTAYVPAKSRLNYYCGGTWFGPRAEIIGLIHKLAGTVERDLQNGITATWHDESHLNRWATENNHDAMSPEFCFLEGAKYLKGVNPIIIAVTKTLKTRH
jgi:hypothetical protein